MLALIGLSGCAGIFSGPPAEHQVPDDMKSGGGLVSGDEGKVSVEL